MTHPRAAIREAIRARLATPTGDAFPTSAKGRVYKSRMAPVDVNDDAELPALLIYSRDEKRRIDVDYGPDGQDSYVRPELCIVVEGIVRAKDNVDDKLDALAEQIEAALDDWEIPGFEGATMRLGDTDIDAIAEAGRKPVGAIGLVYHVRYERVWRPRPAKEEWDLAGARKKAPVEDEPTERWGYSRTEAVEDQDLADGVPTWLARRSLPGGHR